jgi:signal peptidase II
MQVNQTLTLLPGVLKLTFVRNSGAAFGLFPGRQPVFVLTSLAVLFVIAAYWRRARPVQRPVVIALALIASGALGNLIDRAFIGHVTDFFEFAFVDFPVFNVADMAIVAGVGVLMVWILFGPPEQAPAEVQGDADGSEGDAGRLPADGVEATVESALQAPSLSAPAEPSDGATPTEASTS